MTEALRSDSPQTFRVPERMRPIQYVSAPPIPESMALAAAAIPMQIKNRYQPGEVPLYLLSPKQRDSYDTNVQDSIQAHREYKDRILRIGRIAANAKMNSHSQSSDQSA